MNKNSILFDLDGTLLDTAQDFIFAINFLRKQLKLEPIEFADFRKHAYGESDMMVSYGFNITKEDPAFRELKSKFLETYHQNTTINTCFFPGVTTLLNYLDCHKISWGVVTNKPQYLSEPIISHFEFDKRSKCFVTGDTLKTKKPDPEPLLYACELAEINPENTFYVGDLETDIIAARAAGMKSIAVTYGYHNPASDPHAWNADYVVDEPTDILKLFI